MKDAWLTVVPVTQKTKRWLEARELLAKLHKFEVVVKKTPSGPPGVHYPQVDNHYAS